MIGNPNHADSFEFDRNHPSNSISVIIAVYNGAKLISETLKTILGQTLSPTEVIVVNDGSTDDTASVVEEFGDSVRLITTKNQGVCAARHEGAAKATGTWLAFCDHDDLWLPTKLEKQLGLANEVPEVHCVITDYADLTGDVVAEHSHFSFVPNGFWVQEQHEHGFVVREPITGKLTTFQPGITSTPIVKRSFYQSVGGFDKDVTNSAEDTCFHFRCLSAVPFGVVPEVLMHYRRHPSSWSADSAKQLRNGVLVWEHILANYPQAQPFRSDLMKGLEAMRKEVAEVDRYQRRQKLKRLLGFK
jgi:glycosyltransferase involved in cell wall biosynthesis